MLWKIFWKIEPILIKIYHRFSLPPEPNVWGERDIEYSWVVTNTPDGRGLALDFGSGPSWMGLQAARKGWEVIAVDLEKEKFFFHHPRFKFIQGNIFNLNFPNNYFDFIINCSSIEHAGLPGRYGIKEYQKNADLEIMRLMKKILKPEKTMVLTIPLGKDKTFIPFYRVYGQERLPLLLNGWKVLKEEYWVKRDSNQWISVNKKTALQENSSQYYHGLGLFLLVNQ